MGCHLDAEIVQGDDLEFAVAEDFNGSDQDYQEIGLSRARGGLDESSRMSNPNKKEVADIYERNQNQNFQRLFMGAKANFDFNKYQANQEQQSAVAPTYNTRTSQEHESETMLELEDGKASRIVLDSNVGSAPQIAKNIDGETTLRTYC